jgi:hypothetical protein
LISLFASPNGESKKAWSANMITNSKFSHDEDYDFTQDFIASIEQDYITLFIYNKGQGCGSETAGKKASRAIAELYPYNFADKTTYRTYQADNGGEKKMKVECSPVGPCSCLVTTWHISLKASLLLLQHEKKCLY